jgi:hypothetical protein
MNTECHRVINNLTDRGLSGAAIFFSGSDESIHSDNWPSSRKEMESIIASMHTENTRVTFGGSSYVVIRSSADENYLQAMHGTHFLTVCGADLHVYVFATLDTGAGRNAGTANNWVFK